MVFLITELKLLALSCLDCISTDKADVQSRITKFMSEQLKAYVIGFAVAVPLFAMFYGFCVLLPLIIK